MGRNEFNNQNYLSRLVIHIPSSVSPSIIRILFLVLVRQHLKDPPSFRHLQVIVHWCQRVKQVSLLLVDKRIFDLGGFLVVFSKISWYVVLVCKTVGRIGEERRSREDMWVEGVWIHTHFLEHIFMEENTSAEDEALTKHPAQRYPCEAVTGVISNGPTTYFWVNSHEMISLAAANVDSPQ